MHHVNTTCAVAWNAKDYPAVVEYLRPRPAAIAIRPNGIIVRVAGSGIGVAVALPLAKETVLEKLEQAASERHTLISVGEEKGVRPPGVGEWVVKLYLEIMNAG